MACQCMNILVTAGLADYKLSTKLIGILENPEVEKIFLVRKKPLNINNKIININPKVPILTWLPFYEIWRLVTMLQLVRKVDISVIVGIQLIVHGIQAGMVGYLTGRPCVLSVIGKDVHQYLASGLRRRLLSPIVKTMQCIMVMGNQSREIICSLPVDGRRVFTLQNLHDRTRFSPVEIPKQWDLVFVGDLIPRKCVDHLIDAVAVLSNKNISVAIIGEGRLRRSLEKKVAVMKLSDQFDFIGAVNNVEDYLNRAKVLVLPSKTEALPAVAVEAMYCGTPVILTEICDIPTYFKNGEGCLLYPFGDIDALKKCIEQLLEDSFCYSEIAGFCKVWAKQYQSDWSIEQQIQGWQNIFKNAKEANMSRKIH